MSELTGTAGLDVASHPRVRPEIQEDPRAPLSCSTALRGPYVHTACSPVSERSWWANSVLSSSWSRGRPRSAPAGPHGRHRLRPPGFQKLLRCFSGAPGPLCGHVFPEGAAHAPCSSVGHSSRCGGARASSSCRLRRETRPAAVSDGSLVRHLLCPFLGTFCPSFSPKLL